MTEETTPTTTTVAPEPDAAARPPSNPDNPPAEAEPSDTDAADEPDDDPGLSFEDMKLDADVLRALDDMGYAKPMEVQTAVFDPIHEGRDVMVQARTGTGKTAAFGIPLVNSIKVNSPGVQALILCPTRELALQVSRELHKITQHKGVQVLAIYGGAPIKRQVDALEAGAQIVAGTPGRVLDHIRRRTLNTKGITRLVLDECDEMLSMGFQEEIENIIDTLPPKEDRQTMLFSATIPSEIQRIARRHMTEPVEISLSEGGISVDAIDHHYYICSGMAKTKALLRVLMRERPEQAIIFCNTREDTNVVAKFLQKKGYDAQAISSDLSQRERERVMKKMREGKVRFMCATDVAARGIDINDLSHVFNYGFPESPEVYVHRTGRTGRAGKRGVAISLVGPREIGSFYFLKLTYKIEPLECELPDNEEFAAMVEVDRFEKVNEWVSADAPEEWKSLARKVIESEGHENVLASLLEFLFVQQTEARKRAEREERREDAAADAAEMGDREPRRERSSRGRDRDRGGRGGRDRDRDREDRPRRSRRTAEEGAEPREARADGDSAPGEAREARPPRPARARRPADDEAGNGDDSGEARADAGANGAGEEGTDGKRKRRRRRRRRRGEGEGDESRSSSSSSSSSASDGREFWETWADEKNGRADTGAEASDNGDTSAEDGPASVRLYVNIGKREEASADDIRAFLGEIVGDDADKIGAIALRNTHAYVRVPEELVDAVIDGASGKTYAEREVVIERAKR